MRKARIYCALILIAIFFALVYGSGPFFYCEFLRAGYFNGV